MGKSGRRKRSPPDADDDKEDTTAAKRKRDSGEKTSKVKLKAQGDEKKKSKKSNAASKENAKENNGDQEDDDGSKKEDDDRKDRWKLTMDDLDDIDYETALRMRADADRQHGAYTICESHKEDLAECKDETTLLTASVLLEKKLVGRALVHLIATTADAIQQREQLLKERNHFERKYRDLDRTMKAIQSNTDANDILVAAENVIFKDGIYGDLVFRFPFPSPKTGNSLHAEDLEPYGLGWNTPFAKRILDKIFKFALEDGTIRNSSWTYVNVLDASLPSGMRKEKRHCLDTDLGRQVLWGHHGLGVKVAKTWKDTRNNIAYAIRKAIDIVVYSLNKGNDSSNAAPGSPRLAFIRNLMQSAHEGRSVGEEKYQAMMSVLVGIVLMRRVNINNESTRKTMSIKVQWHVPLGHISSDPFAASSLHDDDKDEPMYGNLTFPVPVSALAKYYLNNKTVVSFFKPKQMAFVRLITRLHLAANFGKELKLAYESSGDAFYGNIALTESEIQRNISAKPPFGDKKDDTAERSTQQYNLSCGFREKEIGIFREYEKEERVSRVIAGETVVNRRDDIDSVDVAATNGFSPSWTFPEMKGAFMDEKGQVVPVSRDTKQQLSQSQTTGAGSIGQSSAPSNIMPFNEDDFSDDE